MLNTSFHSLLSSVKPLGCDISIVSHHDDACFVVRQHDRNQTGVGAHRSNDVLCLHASSLLGHTYKSHICDRIISLNPKSGISRSL